MRLRLLIFYFKSINKHYDGCYLGKELNVPHQMSLAGVISLPVFWLAGAGAAVFWVLGKLSQMFLVLPKSEAAVLRWEMLPREFFKEKNEKQLSFQLYKVLHLIWS